MKTTWLLRGGLVALVLWAGHLHFHSTAKLGEHERANRRKIAELNGQLESGRRAIEEIGAMERRAAGARAELDRLTNRRPAGPAVVWFPAWLKEHLRRSGIVVAQIRLNSERPEPALPGFKQTYWNVSLPPQDGMRSMNGVLQAVEEIAHQERFVKVLDCSFQTGSVEPHWPAGGFNVQALVRE